PEISMSKIGVNDLFARIALETNGAINLTSAFRPASTNPPVAVAVTKETPPVTHGTESNSVPKFRITTVAVSNAHVQFDDRTLLPHVRASLQQINGTVTDIDLDAIG